MLPAVNLHVRITHFSPRMSKACVARIVSNHLALGSGISSELILVVTSGRFRIAFLLCSMLKMRDTAG